MTRPVRQRLGALAAALGLVAAGAGLGLATQPASAHERGDWHGWRTCTTATAAPTTTTTAPPTTTATVPAPAPGPGATAATRFGWGTPLPSSDEFSYVGPPDPAKWYTIGNGPGHNGNGRRVGTQTTIRDGMLVMSGDANGNTGWVQNRTDQRGGRWEIRAKVVGSGSGSPYHAVALTWPETNRWPQDAEYDYFEVTVGAARASAFMHYPANTVVQDAYNSGPLDLTQWHTYALDWNIGAQTLTGYIDGVQWFRTTGARAMAAVRHHGTLQLDNFTGSRGLQPATFSVDWYRVYAGAK